MSEISFDIGKFSERLRELMEENGHTTYSLADAVFLTAGTISKYLNAKMEPKRNTIELMAKHFNVNPAWLMGYDVEKWLDVPNTLYKKIPILGSIAAGVPITCQEDILGYEIVEDNDKSTFALKVKGDSMIGARIYDGDIVFVRKQEDVENGEIAAVMIENESVTLKRVYKLNGSIILHSENPTIPDMVFSKKDKKEITILGKVTYVKFEAK